MNQHSFPVVDGLVSVVHNSHRYKIARDAETCVANAAIFILTGNESHADYGRLANGLEAAKEFVETEGDEVTVVFDGGGTQWIPELIDAESDYHELYQAISDEAIVCDYCASAFGVEESVDESGLTLVDEYEGHPSVRDFVADGYEVITF